MDVVGLVTAEEVRARGEESVVNEDWSLSAMTLTLSLTLFIVS